MQFGGLIAVVTFSAAVGSFLQVQESPVSRVVGLLQDLAKTVQADQEKEEALYKKFTCWGKNLIKEKTEFNAKAEARITELQTYINSISSGALELTSERTDKEKEISRLSDGLESSQRQREQEQRDFEAAETEMSTAITALNDAIGVLAGATNCPGGGPSLVTAHQATGVREAVQGTEQAQLGFAQRTAEVSSLRHAADLGDRFLEKADARFLRKLLTGDVPKPRDWKKLNKEATFKKGYKARSCKIMDVLKHLLATFETNLSDTQSKNKKAIADHTKLSGSQQELLEKEQEALSKGKLEKAEGAKSQNEAGDEITTLSGQVEDNKKAMADVSGALDTKKTEWKDRQSLRAGELQAISKAIEILHNDDSRDLFRKSFKSQGKVLLQAATGSLGLQVEELLREVARQSHDQRVVAFAQLAKAGEFAEVIKAVDEMVENLRVEEKDELAEKENCEKERADNTREAAELARGMDDLTDTMNREEAGIQQRDQEIADNMKTIAAIKAQVDEATTNRKNELSEYTSNTEDDRKAKTAVEDAIKVLRDYYSQFKEFSGVQKARNVKDAPSTWTGDYGGRSRESTNIVAMLQMVAEDIQNDMDRAKASEVQAVASFSKFTGESDKALTDLGLQRIQLDTARGDHVENKGTARTDRGLKHEQLKQVVGAMKGAEPSCSFYTLNFELRTKNRRIEIDGLLKAKAALQGAVFPSKSNNAFLQRS